MDKGEEGCPSPVWGTALVYAEWCGAVVQL